MILRNTGRWRARAISGASRGLVWVLMASPLCLEGVPLLWLGLGPDPALAILKLTGIWAMWALGVVLLLTPIQLLASWPGLASVRRLIGLWTFFYAAVHALAYVAFDQGFDFTFVVADALARPMIAVGWVATLIMSWMAATSNAASIKALGFRRWKHLHRGLYVAAGLAWLHLYWVHSGKQTWSDVVLFGLWFGLALLFRLMWFARARLGKHARG